MDRDCNVLIISGSPETAELCCDVLTNPDANHYRLDIATSANEAMQKLADSIFDCVLLENTLSDENSQVFLHRLQELYPDLPIVVVIVQGDSSCGASYMRSGAKDYIALSSIDKTSLHTVISNAIQSVTQMQHQLQCAMRAPKVMIVDDNPDDREACIRTLKKIACPQYLYLEVEGGDAMLEHLAGGCMPDCILLDYSLPGKNGLMLLNMLQMEYQFLPVILMTGHGNEKIAVQALKLGAQDYLIKSEISTSTLGRAITAAIKKTLLEKEIAEKDMALRKHELELRKRAEELEFANKDLETFTYIASHDLRSPLVNLKGFSSELQRSIDAILPTLLDACSNLDEVSRQKILKECEERIPKAVKFIGHSAEKMDRITAAILQLSRLGRRELSYALVDTNDLVNKCSQTLSHQLQQANGRITFSGLPRVWGDLFAIEQIFGNLLDNSVKYLDTSREGHIAITAKEDGDYVTFAVKDNGRGIAEEDQHKVFEIFRRAGNVCDIPGEGMGMPYVRTLVKKMGGKIWFESCLGEGSCFYFTLLNDKEAMVA